MRAAQASLAALALAAACVQAAELGTLFFSADERARLDRLRRGEPAVSVSQPPARREITGYVMRSDGHGTAFVDGEPVPVDPRSAKLVNPKAREPTPHKPEDIRIERKR